MLATQNEAPSHIQPEPRQVSTTTYLDGPTPYAILDDKINRVNALTTQAAALADRLGY
jgi:hypothetical protein